MIPPQTSMKHTVKKLYGQDAQLLLSFEFILLQVAETFHKKRLLGVMCLAVVQDQYHFSLFDASNKP